MVLVRMLYVVDDKEGRDLLNLLNENNVACSVFYCSEHERRRYDCPRLLTTEGEWRGKDAIKRYIGEIPLLESLRAKYEQNTKEDS